MCLGLAVLAEGGADAASPPVFLIERSAFIRDIKTDRPELSAVKTALERGDSPGAGRAYIAYFRQKDMAWPLWTNWAGVVRDARHDTAAADSLLAGHLWDGYHVYDVPAGGIDWRQCPLAYVTRFPIFPPLVEAAAHTRDPKYARFIVDHVLAYMRAYPMEEFVGKGSFGVMPWGSVTRPWHWSMMPSRVQQVARALPILRTFPEVTDDELLAILHRTYQESCYCRLAMKRWVDKRHNGGLNYIRGMTDASRMLEDFAVSDDWRTNNAAMLAQYIERSFYPDGQCVEVTLAYSASVAYGAQELAYPLIDQAGIRAIRPRLAAVVDWAVGMSQPTGPLPSYGDLSARHLSKTLYRPILDWLDVPYARTIADRIAGPLPPYTVWPPPGREAWGGYYTMRSDWTERALYLCMNAGPRGTSGHGHGDKLSLVVAAHGADFIVDPGSTKYQSNEPDSFVSTQAAGFLHNTITIDGVDAYMNEPPESATPLENRWEHGAHHTLLEGRFSFAPVKLVQWTRRVIFVDRSYWLLQDVLTGDAATVAVEQNFQFDEGMAVTLEGGRAVARATNGASLALIPFSSALRPAVSCGDRTARMTYWPGGKPEPSVAKAAGTNAVPLGRGWVGRSGKTLFPAPAVTYSGVVTLPAVITLAIVPAAPGGRAPELPPIARTVEAGADVWTAPVSGGALRITTAPDLCRVEGPGLAGAPKR